MAAKKKQVAETNELPAAPKFVLSKRIRKNLPANEALVADAELWEKSGGKCRLCGRSLDPSEADPDHFEPESAGGSTTLSNLFLAHKACNQSRGNLPISLAGPVVEFRAFHAEKRALSYDHVIDRYVKPLNPQAPMTIECHFGAGNVRVTVGATTITETPVYVDPATGVKYFFMEAPVEAIFNDVEVQPRLIIYSHVRALALDFAQRPVHEPSGCRLELVSDSVGRLLQFDGQHKTTAQILLGRTRVPVKVYVSPDKAMIQQLVLKVQQEIKKQPLTRSDTLAKLGDVVRRRLEEYEPPKGSYKSEAGFIEAQPADERKAVQKEYFQELLRLVYYHEDNELALVVKPGSVVTPTTDRVVIDKVIAPLIWKQLLDVDMEQPGGRDVERENVLLVLNTIRARMLPEGWEKNELTKARAQLFFQQGAIGYWVEELITALRMVTQRAKASEPLLLDPIEGKVRGSVIAIVESLCDWPVWSTQDEGKLAAIRSNTQKNVKEALVGYDYKRMIQDLSNK